MRREDAAAAGRGVFGGEMYLIELKPGEQITVGSQIKIRLEKTKGEKARLWFDAPREIEIKRVKVPEQK
jgi:sRNA-binding carbon storage regulator CsrA